MNFFYFICMLVLGIYIFYYFYKKTNDVLNPFGMSTIGWCIFGGIASMHLTRLEGSWNLEMYITVALFPIICILVGLRSGKIIHVNPETNISFHKPYLLLSRIVFLVCIICMIVEWKEQNFRITFNMTEEQSDLKAAVGFVSGYHYGTVYLPYCGINSFFELLYRKNKSKMTWVFLIFSIVIPILQAIFISVSRGTLLVMFTGMLFIISRKIKIDIKKIIACVAIVLLVFVLIAQRRLWENSLVFNLIDGHPAISSVYTYTVLNFENLRKLTCKGPTFSLGARTLCGVLQTIGLSSFFILPDREITLFFNATPLVYDFYDDFWIPGVIFFSMLLFELLKILYNASKRSPKYILLMASLQKALWMTFFGNYFTSYRIILFPYIITTLLMLSMGLKFADEKNIKIIISKKRLFFNK